MSKKKVKVNCIGVGHWGPNLIRIIATYPMSELGMVCDISENRLQNLCKRMPGITQTTTDPYEAINDQSADCVIIATPAHTHFKLAKAALEAGKHVLVEKPICSTSDEALQLCQVADAHGKILAVGHVFLFNAAIRRMKQLIESGELGKINYIYSTRTNLGPIRTDVNALWDLAAHDLSIFDYWVGEDPRCVSAIGRAFINPKCEDVVFATFEYPNGMIASMHASWLNPCKVREITVVGDKKMAVVDDVDVVSPIRIYNKSVERETQSQFPGNYGEFRTQIRNGDIVFPHVTGEEPLAAECAHFINCVLSGEKPINNGPLGVRVVRALEAANKSLAANGAAVNI